MSIGGMQGHIFTNASISTISGGTFIVNHTHKEKSALEKLSAAAAHSALHDAPARTDETRCQKNTRTQVLDRLERWAQGLVDEEASIFWLHGGAGAGKSAIMQTLAERFVAEGLALGSFFFWRGDPTRNTADVLIPTLVYQLTQLFPSTLEVLGPIFDRDPLIFNKNFQVQVLNLLVRPLEHLVQLGNISNISKSPCVFLIDGLDECGDPAQQQAIVKAAALVCHKHSIPVKFLIASREEQAISEAFELYKDEKYALDGLSLSEDPNAWDDILHFIEAEFLKMRLHHPFKRMIPSEWPDGDDIDTLVRRASAHFIYASTTMKYIWSAQESPVRSLQVVLGLKVTRTISPFSELDALYHHILKSSTYPDDVLQIIGHCVYSSLYSRFSMTSIVCFMLDCSDDDLFIYLADITPLVVISKSDSPFTRGELNVRLLHASIGDFLRDHSRSGPLYVSEEVYLASKLERCFQLADIGIQNQQPQDSSPSIEVTYWVGHDLYAQIVKTIQIAGDLAATQEVLGRYSLRKFFEWRLCLKHDDDKVYNVLLDFFSVFLAVCRIKTSEGVTLFKSSAEDFLNILDADTSLQKTPLTAAIFKLIFSGYPANGLSGVLDICMPRRKDPFGQWVADTSFARVFAAIPAAQLASIQEDLNASSEFFLVAATEVILQYIFDGVEESGWERQYCIQSLFDVLLWALPKVAASQTIELYSNRTNTIRERDWGADHDIAIRVADCLDKYHTRIRNAKLAQLEQRIENGDIDAVIEKSCMLVINQHD